METRQVNSICSNHGDYQQIDVMKDGKWIIGTCRTCDIENSETKNTEDYKERCCIYRNTLLLDIGVPKRFTGKNFDNYNPNSHVGMNKALSLCRSYTNKFDKLSRNGICLTLCGMPGTGKTHLACAIANELMVKYKIHFSGVYRAISAVKATFSGGSPSEQDMYEKFASFDLLILDEIGVQYGSETEKIIMFEILNRRYEAMKPTIIISNLEVEELTEYIGSRVMDRLKEGGGPVIAFDWESYRK